MPDVQLKPLPFDEAIQFFNEKGYRLSPNSFRDVWARDHVQAFTVAKVTAMDVLEDIRKEVSTAVAEGIPLNRFKSELRKKLETKGWFAPSGEKAEIVMPDGTVRKRLTPWRLDTIYRTNLQAAYQAGRYNSMLEAAEARPYWVYDAVMDSRTRPSHAALDGKVYRFDHPFWDRFYPPLGYNCRCTVRTLSEKQRIERGLPEEKSPPPFVKPDEGFDYNVGLVRYQPDLTKYSPEGRRHLLNLPGLPPQDARDMASNMTLMREGFVDSGVRASIPAISLYRERMNWNGYADYATGKIALRTDLADEITGALNVGKSATQKQADAFKTLVHEFGHHLGHDLDRYRYAADQSYLALAETINDLWARYRVGEFLRSTGIRYELSKVRNVVKFHPTGYQPWVERMQTIFKVSGIDEIDQKSLLDRLNLVESPSDYSSEMWKAIRAKKPGVTESGDFGELLLKDDRFNYLLSELRA